MSSSPGPTFRDKLSIQLEPWHRSLQFWVRVADVYAGYKVCQFRAGLTKDAGERETMWERQHELAADKLYTMCYEMGGFFLKAAQLVGKPDLAPAAWVRRLVTLCDRAPATPFEVVQKILEEDLGQSFSMMFEKFDEVPLGSASIAQVHRARVRGAKSDVAVKVQHPGVHRLMMTDIHNLQAFALFLQKTEIKFDLFSATKEVEKQVEFEFDFMREADSMEKIHHFLHYKNKKSPVLVPRVFRGLVTRRVLVMDFFDGIPIMNLGAEMARRGINPSGKIAVAAKQSILKSLTQAYGQMILGSGFFHADPHPGNILICKGSEIALLDYGQVKDLPENLRLGYANLVLAMADTDPARISESFKEMGIETGTCGADQGELVNLARGMFDTRLPPGVQVMSPFEDDSSLKTVGVESFPEELFFVLRAIQLLRGLSSGLGINYSCAEQWRPIAEEALRRSGRLKALERRRGFWRRMLRRG
ncbi:unnamed protein product [Spirodela intermedia]|uniref:Protein kinase domain-containing protein n=1 Tax=Spirodela intermedia TaxID=51605 RepID=A0A7I8KUD3_SPIIN|nr:unnamed protein product [Spirodela intermedia]